MFGLPSAKPNTIPIPPVKDDQFEFAFPGEQNPVIVAVDCSEASRHAAKYAAALFPGKPLQLVYCYPPLETTVTDDDFGLVTIPDPEEARKTEEFHKSVLRKFEDDVFAGTNVKYSGHLLEGDPKTLLEDTAKDWKASAIVVGSHGKNLLSRFLLGSTSNYLAHHSKTPVIIVREPEPTTTPPATSTGGFATSTLPQKPAMPPSLLGEPNFIPPVI